MKKLVFLAIVAVTLAPFVLSAAGPTAITDFACTALSTSAIKFTFTAPIGPAVSYDVRYSPTKTPSNLTWATLTQATGEPIPGAAGTPQSYDLGGLASNTTYKAAIKSINAGGTSAISNVAICNTLSDYVQVTLAWNPNSETDLAGYKLLYGTETGDYDYLVDVGLTNTPETPRHTLTLWRGLKYYFVATAYNDSLLESEEYSNEVSNNP